MKIEVKRNGQSFGPYPLSVAQQYLDEGTLLPNDLAREEGNSTAEWKAVSKILSKAGISGKRKRFGHTVIQTFQNFRSLDLNLIFPWQEISSLKCLKDRRLIYLAVVGLTPAIALTISPGVWVGYWAIAFYFSALWALFFYYLFKTSQVKIKYCFISFFFTALVSIPLLLLIQLIPPWTDLYAMAQSDSVFIRGIGMFLGVGINEEICKAAILFWLIKRPGHLLMPQTVVFYGLMSGLGFGIYEGVTYQQTVNREMGVDFAYFLNIARLTSLPFLHAVWTGIAAYFLSFSALYPNKKYGLRVIAILTPALFHAVYNTFGWGFIGLGSSLLSVILLTVYLSSCKDLQKNLRTP